MLPQKGQFQYLFKVVLVGNSCVGKSSLVIRYADNEFSEVFLATIGVDFRFKSFSTEDSKIKLQIWDTAGHERFRTITSSYYRGAHALMIVFDLTELQSYNDAIAYWFVQIRNSCPPQTQVVLVGNKCDLEDKRVVRPQTIREFLEAHPDVKYMETSAKTAEHVEQAFVLAAKMLVEHEQKTISSKSAKLRGKVVLSETTVEVRNVSEDPSEPTNSRKCCY